MCRGTVSTTLPQCHWGDSKSNIRSREIKQKLPAPQNYQESKRITAPAATGVEKYKEHISTPKFSGIRIIILGEEFVSEKYKSNINTTKLPGNQIRYNNNSIESGLVSNYSLPSYQKNNSVIWAFPWQFFGDLW